MHVPHAAGVLLAAAAALVLTAAAERTYLGHRVVDMEFTIAGGERISLPVTDAGPIPAEARGIKIEAAGPTLQPAVPDSQTPHLAWGFVLTAKKVRALERVVVEEVHPSTIAAVVVDDASPALRDDVWAGRSDAIEPEPAASPWLFTDGDSVFVFRFTVTPSGKRPVVLYQPVWISHDAKQRVQHAIRNIRSAG